VATLRQIGLLAWPTVRRTRESRVAIQRSPAGQAVVDVCRSELETAQRLLWTRRLRAIRAALAPYLRDPAPGLRQALEQRRPTLARLADNDRDERGW
jgi:hypothetical protein